MRYRTLGRTGIKVSAYALGAMMFGAIGNPDHDDSIRIIHKALDAGINVIDTAPVYSNGESEEIVGKALKGRRDNVVLATKVHRGRWFPGRTRQRRSQPGRQLKALDHDRGRGLAAPTADRLDRPVPDPPARPRHRHRGDAVRAV